MRKIKSHFFISLDGVVESPNEWHFPYFNDEMGAAVGAGFGGADAVLNLLVHPLAVGRGLARLFPPDEPPIPLELIRSEAFQTGVLNLSYGPAAPAG